MQASKAYQEYCAIKAHFERLSYSYMRYNGQIRAGNYEERKDKNWFFRLSRAFNSEQLQDYYVANFLAGNAWVGSMTKDAYLTWKYKMSRLYELFENDLNAIQQLVQEKGITMNEVFKCSQGQHPIIFKMLLGQHIELETFTILNMRLLLTSRYREKLEDDPIWTEWAHKIDKYGPWLKCHMVDKSQYSNLIREKLLNTID